MDEATLQFYRGNADAYAQREITSRKARLTAFLALLPPGARILELGCGAGGDTAAMLTQGFDVRATDGSPEMAAVASKRLGRSVETLLFHELDAVEKRYPGLDRVICATPLGTPLDVQLTDLDRFAKEVIPAFRDTRTAAAAQ